MINLNSITKKYIILSKSIRKKLRDIYYLNTLNEDNKLNVDYLKSTSYSALKDITTSFEYGENIGIVGLNGSGKTTLLKILLGFINQTKGTHNIDPNDIELIDASRVEVDMDLKVSELINNNLIDFDKEERLKWIKEILNYFDLNKKSQDYFGTLSLGTRSRLVFAIATITKKNILLIDEVLGSGDPYWSERCVIWLKKLSFSKKIVLITSHNTQLLQKFCKKGLWIEQGKIKSFGEMKDVEKEYEIFALSLAFAGISKNNSKKLINKIKRESTTYLDNFRINSLFNLQISRVKVYDSFGNIHDTDCPDQQILRSFPVRLELSYTSKYEDFFWPTALITFWAENGVRLFTSQNKSHKVISKKGQEHKIIFEWGVHLPAKLNMKISVTLFNSKSMMTSNEDLYREDMIYKFCDVKANNEFNSYMGELNTFDKEIPLLVNL